MRSSVGELTKVSRLSTHFHPGAIAHWRSITGIATETRRCILLSTLSTGTVLDQAVPNILAVVTERHFRSVLCAALLIQRGADLSVRNNRGNTPLALAVVCQNWELVALLLSHGANIDDYYFYSRTIQQNQATTS